MFHLLFVPRYLDYVQTDLGGLLRPVTKLSARAFFFFFSFHCLSTSPTLPLAKHTAVLFFPLSSSPLLAYPVTSHHRAQIPPFSSFSASIHPSIHPHSSVPPLPLSSLSPAFLCSAVTLSSLPRVLLQAYSVLDAEFYCHSVYTGTLWVRAFWGDFHYAGFSVISVSDSNAVTSCREFHTRLLSLLRAYAICIEGRDVYDMTSVSAKRMKNRLRRLARKNFRFLS